MGLLDGIEKLINEHGSAAILKERIALAEDKYATLERKLSESELRAKEIESKNDTLRLDLEKAQQQIRNFEERLVDSHGERLDEVKEKILCWIAKRDETEEPNIFMPLNISEQLAKFHLQDLSSARLISTGGLRVSMDGRPKPMSWRLTQEGRRYLFTHGLLA